MRANEAVKFIMRRRVQPNDAFFIDGSVVDMGRLAEALRRHGKFPGMLMALSPKPGQTIADVIRVAETALPDLIVAARELNKLVEKLRAAIPEYTVNGVHFIPKELTEELLKSAAPDLAHKALKKAGAE